MKAFVLDTNVLLSDPNAITAFEDNLVIIPTIVLQEIDSKKKLMDEVGRNAREVARLIEALRNKGSLNKGIALENGGQLKVVAPPSTSNVYDCFLNSDADSAIIAVAQEYGRDFPFKLSIISQDILVRLKADALGIEAEDYKNEKVIKSTDEHYKGYQEISLFPEDISRFKKTGKLDEKLFSKHYSNEFALIKNGSQEEPAVIKEGRVNKLYNYNDKQDVFGLRAKNTKQKMALELLLNDSISLVTISGKAGTGKTLLALASALQKTVEERSYHKIIAARPVVPLGKDIGYLPGEKEEKLKPWMQPIFDNLEYLFNCNSAAELSSLMAGYEKIIEVEALTYIRGRTIPYSYIIVDEAQNLTKHEVTTIITRAGVNSKVVLVGDQNQIDHPYLDQYTNGLTYVVEKMKDSDITGHVNLTDGERSALAQLAADILV